MFWIMLDKVLDKVSSFELLPYPLCLELSSFLFSSYFQPLELQIRPSMLAHMQAIDRSIFRRLSQLILVHLCYYFLVNVVFQLIFVCLQVQRVKVPRKCILVHFGAVLGTKWIAHVWANMDGRIWSSKGQEFDKKMKKLNSRQSG